MSGLLMGRAFYTSLPNAQKFLLVALCDHANDEGGGVFVGQRRLAIKVGTTDRTVRANLAVLREEGYIERTHKGSGDGRRGIPDHYQILVERLPGDKEIDAMVAAGTPEESSADVSGNTGNLEQEHRKIDAEHRKQLLPPNRQLEPSVKATGLPAPRKRDAIWDVIADIYGQPTNTKFRGKVVKVLREYGADPDEIRTFIEVMAGTDRDWAVTTPTALAKHFGERNALMAQVQNPRKRKVGQSAELMRQAMEG